MLHERDYGVTRRAHLALLPEAECARHVLDSIEAITRVDEINKGPDLYQWRYEGRGFWAIVGWRRPRDAEGWNFFHERVSVNRRPSSREVEATRRMMRLVEGRLVDACGMRELEGNVHEMCEGVRCAEIR